MLFRSHGILQARRREWVAFPFSRGSSQPRDRTQVSHIAGRFFTSGANWEAQINRTSIKKNQNIHKLINFLKCSVPCHPQRHGKRGFSVLLDVQAQSLWPHPPATVLALGNAGREVFTRWASRLTAWPLLIASGFQHVPWPHESKHFGIPGGARGWPGM